MDNRPLPGPGPGRRQGLRRVRLRSGLAPNPLHVNFNLITVDEGIGRLNRWCERYRLVRTRPRFQVKSIRTIIEEGPNQPQIISVLFRGGLVIEGTFRDFFQYLDDQISAAVDKTFENEAIVGMPPQQQQQQQQQGMPFIVRGEN